MGQVVHSVDVLAGSAPLSNPDRLKVGLLTAVAIGALLIGAPTAVEILNPGSFTSMPAVAGGSGAGAAFTPSLAVKTTAEGAAGATYAPNDTITLTGGTASVQGIVEVLTTKAVTAPAVAAGGTLYVVGDQITLQNGLIVQVATLSGSAVATVTIVAAGAFTANNTGAGGLTQISTTGAGTGATFTMTAAKYGVNTYVVLNAGSYSVLPSSPVAQGSTTGSGTGFTLAVSAWQLQGIATAGGQGYKDGDLLAITGGGTDGTAAAEVTTAPIGEPIAVNVASFEALPASFMVFIQPNGRCTYEVTNKNSKGFTVTFHPISASEPIYPSAFDAIVVA